MKFISLAYNTHGYLSEVKNGATGLTYWEAKQINARGQIEIFDLGNGLQTVREFNNITGELKGIVTGNIQNLSFAYDELGRLKQRKDVKNNMTENFGYDGLNRLTSTAVVGKNSTSIEYNDIGNITYKSDVGVYEYGENGAGPHAVTSINSQASAISELLSQITWTPFDKVASIEEDIARMDFIYGPEQDRKKVALFINDTLQQTTYHVGGIYEKEISLSGTKEIHYIHAGGNP